MVEKDAVVIDLKIKQKAQFNLVELYHSVKAWYEINKYVFYEFFHEEKVDAGKKSLVIKWRGIKELDEYTKFELNISLIIPKYEMIKGEKEKLIDGPLNIGFKSFVITDYEDKWNKTPVMKFMKGVSDHFFTVKKREKFRKELENDTYDLYNKIKSFLNLHKFR
ncbi:hypothetical protein K8R33_04290 [archaeon]|nr:hypothetical protein [archaeon]